MLQTFVCVNLQGWGALKSRHREYGKSLQHPMGCCTWKHSVLESLWLLAGSPRCFWSFKRLWLNRILPRETSALSFKSHHSPSCQIQLELLNNAFPFKIPISLLRKQMTQIFYIRVKQKEFLEQSSPNRTLLLRIVIPENRFFGQIHLWNSG